MSTHRNFTDDAVTLFSKFVARHGFTHEVETDAPVEVLWHVPAQRGLSLPLTLCLSNNDELSLGVEEFWSWFFPFDDVAEWFEDILDKWVAGDARILAVGRRGRILEAREGTNWQTAHEADVWFSRKVKWIVQNDPTYSNSTIT